MVSRGTRPRMLQICAADHMALHCLRPLMHAARTDGWDVEFVCADGPGAAILRSEGFRHHAVQMSRGFSALAHASALAITTRVLKRLRPDLVHTHTPVGGVVGRASAALASIANVVHTFHGLPFETEPTTPAERLFLAAEQLVARRTSMFLSQSRADGVRAIRLGIARPSTLEVIGNGVDLARFRPDARRRSETRAALGIRSDQIVILCAARLVREKGILDLADAVAHLRDSRLIVLLAGRSEPSDRSRLEPELDAHPASRAGSLLRLGYRADIECLMNAADMYVLPSYREGLPRSVIEGMASALPVVATDLAGCRELIDAGTGVLVPPRDPERLAEALDELAHDEGRRIAFGTRARELAEQRHDENLIVRRQLDLFAAAGLDPRSELSRRPRD